MEDCITCEQQLTTEELINLSVVCDADTGKVSFSVIIYQDLQ